ncbi:MAG: ABC-F family ATP-binding cassette domain-containing protein [Bacteroidales bacterium]|jgi:ATP-binding cassette subfamily F protein uup|nr:ABC-F family ATP-binding cassette domain-containing protein [Bacteroidales bacterium]MDD4655235.1 ABC-F family ATP-binding cassette domain-containing protein [Bacteroidales bacterium]
MASYLQVGNISKSYGDHILFNQISFNINEGDKIALIAPNGSGKTTLLNILAGKDAPDSGGSVLFLKDISIAFLEQDPVFDPEKTLMEELITRNRPVFEALTEYRAASGSGDKKRLGKAVLEMERLDGWNIEQRIKKMLTSLKLNDPEQKIGHLSGGEVKRAAIAGLLLQDADFLILDEPTNHLDMEIIEFLEDYLKKSRSTLFMVTHDRYFLDRVCNTIYELDRGDLYVYKGNYQAFLEKREERVANMMAGADKARNLFRRELEWIRSTPCARTGKARYRIDAFHELKERTQVSFDEKKVNINVKASRLGTKIINCRNLSYNYGERCMLRDFTYHFSRYEKVGIVGENGVGKSTFLNLIIGELAPVSGEIEQGETVRFGYYRQEGMSFNPQDTVFDIVHDIAEVVTLADGKQVPVNTFLNYFLFPPSMHYVKVERLSGGEKRRLYLLTILMRNPNFLILDEPTNDLDIMTLNVLEDYLQDFAGCLLIVSHDRYFMDKLVDHLFVFTGDGVIKDYTGKCSEYREYMKSLTDPEPKSQRIKTRQVPENTVKPAKLTYKEQKRKEELEKDIEALELEKKTLEEQLSACTLPAGELTKASVRIGEVMTALDDKMMQWIEIEET